MPTLLSEAALRLRQHIAQFVALRDDDWDLLLPHLRLVTIKKHGLFAQEGRLAGQVAFVLEGMFRQFYTKDGKERTTYFFLRKPPAERLHELPDRPALTGHHRGLERSLLPHLPVCGADRIV